MRLLFQMVVSERFILLNNVMNGEELNKEYNYLCFIDLIL